MPSNGQKSVFSNFSEIKGAHVVMSQYRTSQMDAGVDVQSRKSGLKR